MIWFIVILVLVLLGYRFYKVNYSKEAKKKAAAEEKRRQEETERKIAHYEAQPLCIKVASRISSAMRCSITSANRAAHIRDISVTYTFSVFNDCITHSFSPSHEYEGTPLVVFEHERIEDLSYSERDLVAVAVFRLVKKEIQDEFPNDPGGLGYSIRYSRSTHRAKIGSGKYSRETQQMEYNYKYGERYTITYSCRNGLYREKTKL